MSYKFLKILYENVFILHWIILNFITTNFEGTLPVNALFSNRFYVSIFFLKMAYLIKNLYIRSDLRILQLVTAIW